MHGKILNLYLKTAHAAPMQPAQAATAVAGKGFQGDLSFGREKRQLLIIEAETLREFDLQPGQVRENLTVAGLKLAGLPAGTRVRAGEALLEVTLDCAPCEFIEGIRPGLRAAISGQRGTLFRVITGGQVKVGDDIAVLTTEAA